MRILHPGFYVKTLLASHMVVKDRVFRHTWDLVVVREKRTVLSNGAIYVSPQLPSVLKWHYVLLFLALCNVQYKIILAFVILCDAPQMAAERQL
jgi:hypothetical protein